MIWEDMLIGAKGLLPSFLAGLLFAGINGMLWLFGALSLLTFDNVLLTMSILGSVTLLNLSLYLIVWGYLARKIHKWD